MQKFKLLSLLFVECFSHQHNLIVFNWGWRDSKILKGSRSLLRILVYLSNAIVWMVLARPLIQVPLALLPSLWEPYQGHHRYFHIP